MKNWYKKAIKLQLTPPPYDFVGSGDAGDAWVREIRANPSLVKQIDKDILPGVLKALSNEPEVMVEIKKYL